MKLHALAAALAVVAIPIAVQGAESPPRTARDPARRTCEVERPAGSRLGGVRRCRNAAEREAAKQEARRTVERVQSWKPSFCTPPQC